MSSNPETRAAFTPMPLPDGVKPSELEHLEFQIEGEEYDCKQADYAISHSMSQAKVADEEEMPALAALWRFRAQTLRDEIKLKRQAIKDAKTQRRALLRPNAGDAAE